MQLVVDRAIADGPCVHAALCPCRASGVECQYVLCKCTSAAHDGASPLLPTQPTVGDEAEGGFKSDGIRSDGRCFVLCGNPEEACAFDADAVDVRTQEAEALDRPHGGCALTQ